MVNFDVLTEVKLSRLATSHSYDVIKLVKEVYTYWRKF